MDGYNKIAVIFLSLSLVSCDGNVPKSDEGLMTVAAKDSIPPIIDSLPADKTRIRDAEILPASQTIDAKNVHPSDVVAFAKTLIGTPYVYASTNPQMGFDCSGFITYVFNHFGISVPRSSVDFTDVGKTVPVEKAKPGDLILFTGTNPMERQVGHMGIVTENTDSLRFIHSSSGKAMGVTITPLNEYYKSRFVRVTRIFPQNDATS